MISGQKPGIKESIAEKLAKGILSVQEKFSARMNRLRQLKALLIGFCVISATLSTYFLVEAIVSKPESKIKIEPIRIPRAAPQRDSKLFDERLPDDLYRDLQEYKRYMDSTRQQIRPGLADSIRLLEQLYLEQQKD